MPGYIVAVAGNITDEFGDGQVVGPPGVGESKFVGITAGGFPVLVVSDSVSYHGNPNNPDIPGFQPLCGCSQLAVNSNPLVNNIRFYGLPPGVVGGPGIGTRLVCGHYMQSPGIPTIQLGGPTPPPVFDAGTVPIPNNLA